MERERERERGREKKKVKSAHEKAIFHKLTAVVLPSVFVVEELPFCAPFFMEKAFSRALSFFLEHGFIAPSLTVVLMRPVSGEIGRERDGEWVWTGRGGGGVRGKEKYVMYTCCICVEPTTKKFLGGEY